MTFVERFIILCPYLGGSTIGGSTVYTDRITKSVIEIVLHLSIIYRTCTGRYMYHRAIVGRTKWFL